MAAGPRMRARPQGPIRAQAGRLTWRNWRPPPTRRPRRIGALPPGAARPSGRGAHLRRLGLPARDSGEVGLGRPAADAHGLAAVALAERGELGPRNGAKTHAVDRRREALAVVEEKTPAGEMPV